MKLLLIATAYNSLTQRIHVELSCQNHDVSIELALNEKAIIEAVENFHPDLIIASFLKTAIPESVWKKYTCVIVHPGIKGDRGPSSLDWAIINGQEEWGITVLEASEEWDAGDIWSSVNFKMRAASKGNIYRCEVGQAAVQAVLETIEKFKSGIKPEPLDYSNKDIKGQWQPYMKQAIRTINWEADNTSTIIKKISSADSYPGCLDEINGQQYYLFGAHEEDILKGKPGEIIAKRHGAICRATVDGAVWISYLKQKHRGELSAFKLPAEIVLGESLKGIPTSRIPLDIEPSRRTFKEIWYEERNQVGYLHFDFYNGAMNTEQCQRLKQAYLYAKSRPTKVIVLMGGQDFFSNGIHLNIIEASQDPGMESWLNIQAIDDFVEVVLKTDSHMTISAIQGNAAAGGVMLAIAADLVYAREGVVLNPHYKRMGLYGSEYWTYSLPQRVGQQKANEITANCMPMGVQVAKKIGLIDSFFGSDNESFCQQVEILAQEIAKSNDYEWKLKLKQKKLILEENYKPLNQYRQEELEQMKINFFGADSTYHTSRKNFVYKVPPTETPIHLAKHRQTLNSMSSCAVMSV